MPVIQELYFYPIKSLRGIRSSELILDPLGPKYDRQWMLVDPSGRMITQRTMPSLARIGVMMDENSLQLSHSQFGQMEFGIEERQGEEFQVTVFKDSILALEVSSEVSQWFSQVLNQPVRLVRISENARRGFNPRFAERNVRFVDGKPLLVISVASLNELQEKIGKKLSITRFRPNIVVDQTVSHEEDTWEQFSVKGVKFGGVSACSRCKITTVHPLTGEVGEEPLKTLATYRRQEKGIVFGYYYAHLNEGRISVGDSVELNRPLAKI